MSQCVPNWDADDNPAAPTISLSNYSNSTASDIPRLDYEVAELTWENGQISMQGFGLPRVPAKPATAAHVTNSRAAAAVPSDKHTWEKYRGGTLESIVNQATRLPYHSKNMTDAVDDGGGSNRRELVPWFEPNPAAVASTAAGSNTMTMDALVPCSNRTDERSTQVLDSIPGPSTRMVGRSTLVASCSGAAMQENDAVLEAKRARAARLLVEPEGRCRDRSVRGSAMFGRDSQRVDKELGMGFPCTSMGSPENTSSAKQGTRTTTADDYDSVGHSGPLSEAGDDEENKRGIGKSSVSTKRSRAAAVHNQSERKRRDKINQRMKTLQKLVPNSSKTDKASMLDEVIDYLKQLQAQVQMMNRMNMSPMMLPMALQQQIQMSMMAPMGLGLGMGMGIGMGMDMNSISRAAANISGMPPVIPPPAFMPLPAWDVSGGHQMQSPPPTVMPDPLSAFFACQQQPMSIDAYSRMAAIYQQMQQQPASNSKK